MICPHCGQEAHKLRWKVRLPFLAWIRRHCVPRPAANVARRPAPRPRRAPRPTAKIIPFPGVKLEEENDLKRFIAEISRYV